MWLSVTLEDVDVTAGEPRLRSGEPLGDVLALCQSLSPDALLFNCSQPEVMEDAVSVAHAHFSGDSPHLLAFMPMPFRLPMIIIKARMQHCMNYGRI